MMVRKFAFPLLAIAGFVFACWSVAQSQKPILPAKPVAAPPTTGLNSVVAGSGIIESTTENIGIGTPVSGIAETIYAKVGTAVKKGGPLFRLDDRTQKAELEVRRAALAAAEARLEQLKALPRQEDVPIAEAQVKQAAEARADAKSYLEHAQEVFRNELAVLEQQLRAARAEVARLEAAPRPEDLPIAEARARESEASLADAKNRLDLAESIEDKRAISIEDIRSRRYAVSAATARLAKARAELARLKAGTWEPELEVARTTVMQAEKAIASRKATQAQELSQREYAVSRAEAALAEQEADLAKLKAGAWDPEIKVARAEVMEARAAVRAAETELARLTVTSPIDGEVLQVNLRPGEFAVAGALQNPLVLLGNVNRLHVRVDVDEDDAWRLGTEVHAEGSLRGNSKIRFPLTFVRFEPFVVPKRSLTGDNAERVDTRVLQIIFSFDRGQIPVFVGQQMDIFIQTESKENT